MYTAVFWLSKEALSGRMAATFVYAKDRIAIPLLVVEIGKALGAIEAPRKSPLRRGWLPGMNPRPTRFA